MTVVDATASLDLPRSLDALVAAKGASRVAVCIPARNEEPTVGKIVASVDELRSAGFVDEVVVVDDRSTDATALEAGAAGAVVVPTVDGPGKGQALRAAVAATNAEVLVFLDADVSNFSTSFVTALAMPLLVDPGMKLVKAMYRRPLEGRPDEGGRVTELLAKPLLRRFYPALARVVTQPLAGECAIRRDALCELQLEDGYAIEIGLLIDVYERFGLAAITEVDLGERVHRNRPLHDLRTHADAVLAAVLARTSPSIAPGERT